MKNCLTIVAILFGCFVVAFILVIGTCTNWGQGFPGGDSLMVGAWRSYDEGKFQGMEVTIYPDKITVFIPDGTQFKRYDQKGTWRSHAFYGDSHTDSPVEALIATELPNEDLQINLGYFSPALPDKFVCVLIRRNPTLYHPYPVANGENVSYPPPKGLIRPGMLECDLQTLPWRADHIELPGTVINARTQTLSDGTVVHVPDDEVDRPPQNITYTYHSDRADAPKLLVSVYHGRVVQVVGGAEETADVPYAPPPAPPGDSSTSPEKDSSWVSWLFRLIFSK